MLAGPPRYDPGERKIPPPHLPPMPQTAPGEIETLAREIRQHRIPIFGRAIDFGPEIRWRRDPISGIETSTAYFRRIPYLDPRRAGDHKFIWEPNRHQHLVVLAQAGDDESWNDLVKQLESWFEQNPFQRGINWASALEVAFRALSWVRIYELAHARMTRDFERRFLEQLYRHGCHLEANLSVYFSPNTHLLGEAVALHALGVLFPDFPRAARWKQKGAYWVSKEFRRQVRPDGSHFEQSSYYHVYALDMFLFHAGLAAIAEDERSILARMTEYLESLAGPDRVIPFIGDDDGGRLFHPYGSRETFARHTIKCANAVLGRTPDATRSLRFEDSGMIVMNAEARHILIDAGPFGPGGAGHSHSDTLSIVIRSEGEWILIDPGTYTYVGDREMREWFRSSAAHNTIRIDGREQAIPERPFRWSNPPQVRVIEWKSTATQDLLEAECCYAGFTHRRRVAFDKPDRVTIIDDLAGPGGEHDIEQFWHLGSHEAAERLTAEGGELKDAWRSSVFGEKHKGPVIVVQKRVAFPARLTTVIHL